MWEILQFNLMECAVIEYVEVVVGIENVSLYEFISE